MKRIIYPIVFLLSLAWVTVAYAKSTEEIRIGYVSGGLYEAFVNQKLVTLTIKDIELKFVATQGSREQIELLKREEIDLAIIQSDIAYYAYEGARNYEQYEDFSLVLPLFEEYLQIIVRADSNTHALGRLLNGTVSVGQKGSGTFQNASDLFNELDFRAGIDVQLRYLSISEALHQLQDHTIDGVLYTGGTFPAVDTLNSADFRVLNIPENTIEAMAIRSPYYMKAWYKTEGLANQTPVSTVAVPALLVSSNNLSSSTIAAFIHALSNSGTSFMSPNGGTIELRSPSSAIEQAPIPLHEGLRAYLRDTGSLGRDYSAALVIIVVLVLIGFVATVKIRMRTYDRMGNLTATEGTLTHSLYQVIAKSGSGLIVLFIFFLLVVAFVEAIQFFEDDYARRLNVKNPFADRGFLNSLLWVITFMGAGDPGDVFPNSSPGKFLASILPFLGIGAVLGLGYSSLEKRRERRIREREGTLAVSLKNHVLICGWNEKAPGIIYSLTSSDVPRKRHVVVVAEMDEQTPLDKYGFDLRYVSYCKGDSADHKVLERANARHADVAVVLGGVKKRQGKNVKSVLSVMALREIALRNTEREQNILLIAELLFAENEKLFGACGSDAIVSSETITNRIAAVSSISPFVVDFVLDMLTYDDHCELYALPLELLKGFFATPPSGIACPTLEQVAEALLPLGINVIASHNTTFANPTFLDHVFTGQKFGLLLDADNTELKMDQELLIIADDFRTVKRQLNRHRSNGMKTTKRLPSLDLPGPKSKRVILVGDAERCAKIRDELSTFPPAVVTILSNKQPLKEMPNLIVGDYTDEKVWIAAGLDQAEQVTVLGRPHREVSESANIDSNELDAQAILITKFARLFSKSCRAKDTCGNLQIAAEMLCAANQTLFEDAGVDVVIPTDRILERVITKLIYSRGAVTRFLMALLRFEDGKHFMSFEISSPPPDTSFVDLANSMPDYFQLLGVLPAECNNRQRWVNTIGDFRYHFLCDNGQATSVQYTAKEGDTVIGIINQPRWLSEDRNVKP